jgi:hypothetical protein
MTYYIIRFYANSSRIGHSRVLKRGLTLEQAQEHCRNPETSSRTCQQARNRRRKARFGAWFDGYSEES